MKDQIVTEDQIEGRNLLYRTIKGLNPGRSEAHAMREERDHQCKWIDLSIDFEGDNMKHENRASHFFSLIMLQATTIKYALGCMPLSPTHRPDLGLKYPSSAKTKKRTIGILGLSPLLHQLNNKRRTRMKEINHITNKNLLSHSTIHITLRQSYTPSVQAGYRGQCCKQT